MISNPIMAENQNIEYKESWRTEYLKWLCGFANAQGGTIYVGVNDKGDIVGLPNAKKLMEDIPNQVQAGLGIMPEVNKSRTQCLPCQLSRRVPLSQWQHQAVVDRKCTFGIHYAQDRVPLGGCHH